jgi:hypothetical protein
VYPIVAWTGSSGYVVSTDPGRLNLDFIHAFLVTAYWSRGVPRDTVERAIANSLPFGLYAPTGEQAGFGFGPPVQPDIHMYIERSPAELWPSASDGQSPATGETT